MKKIILALSASLCLLFANAQAIDNTIKQRTINVNGSAELEITPDEIYVQVELREYNKKNGDKKANAKKDDQKKDNAERSDDQSKK